MTQVDEQRIRRAWQGRISGCQLGKPVELLSMRGGYAELARYLQASGHNAVRDYIPYVSGFEMVQEDWCAGGFERSEPDDDINYTTLSLIMLETHGLDLTTADVAKAWLHYLPLAKTYTAERAAYRILLQHMDEWFPERGDDKLDIGLCSDNPYNDWIGAQIRADMYGWVLPGQPDAAAALARQDADLSHRGDGVYGAMVIAALGAALASQPPADALEAAKATIPEDSAAHEAVVFGQSLAGDPDGGAAIRAKYEGLSPVHTINNLAIVVWALYSHLDDFSAAIGDAVAAGLDTDCNGATVGALWGLQDKPIPEHWLTPWQGRVGVGLAGMSELSLDDLVDRTCAVAASLTPA